MDPHNPSVPTYDFVFPFADFQSDEASGGRPSSIPPAPTTFSSSINGRYQLNGTSMFDTEYIDPAMLQAPGSTATSDFFNDNSFSAMQYTQNEVSTYHPDWQPSATDFKSQQQIRQTQQDILEGAFPNALGMSGPDEMSFDWRSGAWQGDEGSLATLDNVANRPTREHLGQSQSSLSKVPRAPMRCEFPSCKQKSFLSSEHFTQHLDRHYDEARDNFVAGGACRWPGCRSRKSRVTFEKEADFDQHLKRHMEYYWCDVPGCKHKEGFARQHDLTRHSKTHSNEREFKCPDSGCTSASLGFPRKDKLDAHIKTRHPHLMESVKSHRCDVHGCTIKKPFDTIEDLEAHFLASHEPDRQNRCPVEGCTRHSNGFTTRGKLIEHIKTEHNPPKCTFDHCDFRSLGNVMDQHILRAHKYQSWECRLPGCEGSVSNFAYERIRAHLSEDHDIKGPNHAWMLYRAAKLGDTSYFGDRTIAKCKHCSQSRAQSDWNEVSEMAPHDVFTN